MHSVLILLICLLGGLFSKSCAKETRATVPYVYTQEGSLKGTYLDEAQAFFSIPYGKPPIGDLRFQDTEPIGYYGDLDVSNNTGVGCISIPVMCSIGQCPAYESEDCLYFNVFVPHGIDLTNPANPPSPSLKVLVWFHGGSFWFGGGLAPLYDGRYMAEVTNSIVISMNYRLMPFGFLTMGTSSNGAPGNMGFHDQQVLLEWVQRNIASFGGDKDEVTIFGESAGAQTVGLHLISSKSAPLFKRAIMDSNPVTFMFKTKDEAQELGKRLSQRAGCLSGSYSCLVTKSTQDIVKAFGYVMVANMAVYKDFYGFLEPFAPVIDGMEFTQQELYAFQSGNWNTDKSFIIGTNSQELSLVSAMIPIPLSYDAFKRMNDVIFVEIADQVTALYAPDPTLSDYRDAYGDELTHFAFSCSSRALARAAHQTKSLETDVYLYLNYHPLGDPDCEKLLGPLSNICGHCYHSSELSFVWRTGPLIGQTYTQDEDSYVNAWSSYIGNFMNSGNPNIGLSHELQQNLGDFVEWTTYTQRSNWTSVALCAPNPYQEREPIDEYCDFWDNVGYDFVIFGEQVKKAMDMILQEMSSN